MTPDALAPLFALIRDVPDFPQPGILFRDITPLLANPQGFATVVEWMAKRAQAHGVTTLAAVEARGFVFGAVVAQRLGLPLQLIRKPGKLPWHTAGAEYDLEYGSDRLEMHADAVGAGDRVAIVDDLLATGGTAAAAARLVCELKAKPACVLAAIELQDLGGREKLSGVPVETLLVYR
ncbi:MAG: adenine phosphoribosyltransferase [Nevskiaceae bacterium]|nr:MAG: adenine phosphoribosyltransferase [Nevskiaceae bacterium]TBR73565.1 MAG: adenine phosphoribosyltransferase [Nevskiaceae bacterium]